MFVNHTNHLVFLHGFLGSPQDWHGVIHHLPEYSCEALSYPFQIPSDAILIGYSMGGRIALRSSQPKILLSTHPGLQTSQEKAKRLEQDQEWIKRLKEEPLEMFLKAWYDQPLFDSLRAHPDFPTILSRRHANDPHVLAKMLAQESLAHQEFTLPKNAFFLHGQLDTKYAQLYRDLQVASLEIPQTGHAAHLENPERCSEMIRSIIKLNQST